MHTEAFDALVNLKKYIRELPGGRRHSRSPSSIIQLIDEFIEKAVIPDYIRAGETVCEHGARPFECKFCCRRSL